MDFIQNTFKMDTKTYSIYRITSPSGKVYIGQSCDIKNRFRTYKYCKPDQPIIYNSLKKYGYENHKFEILLKDLTKEEADIIEIAFIKIYKNGFSDENSLNVASGGSSSLIDSKCKSVLKFSLDGELICEYKSLSEASRDINVTVSSIWTAIKRKPHYSSSFLWLYKEDYNNGERVISMVNIKNKIFYAFNLQGVLIQEFCSYNIAAKTLLCDAKMIKQNLLGKRKRVKDFIFSYNKEIKKFEKNVICKYDLSNNLLDTFKTLNEASEKLNINKKTIKNKLKDEKPFIINNSLQFILKYSNKENGRLSKF